MAGQVSTLTAVNSLICESDKDQYIIETSRYPCDFPFSAVYRGVTVSESWKFVTYTSIFKSLLRLLIFSWLLFVSFFSFRFARCEPSFMVLVGSMICEECMLTMLDPSMLIIFFWSIGNSMLITESLSCRKIQLR